MQHADGSWTTVVWIVTIALGVYLGWWRLSLLLRGVTNIVSPSATDAAPAPLTLGRRGWRVFCGTVAVCCLGAAAGFVWLGVQMLISPEGRIVAIIQFVCAPLMLILARACQRIGRETFRWY